ncbi:endonuclease V isoform X2 [Dromaius novaehollandiae]|uniref:endonuclease V isoform X2 n=1 Tax=Dromaius novaehollandiae TaxID=8790 RepID=UPI00311D3B83
MSGPPAGATLRRWAREQAQLKASVIEEDTEEWQKDSSFAGLERVGGVDLSYVKGDDTNACASLVVLSYPDLEVLYEDCQMVAVTAPYVAGFLAFREVPFLVEAIQRLQQKEPRLKPQVLLVDGNGLLHHRGFGVACHLGVLTDLPCIGVAKNLLQVDGLARDELHREQIRSLQMEGDAFPLTGTSGKVLGMVLRSYNNSSKPLYISVGHRVCLETAVHLVKSCCRYRIPEPIRQLAELLSSCGAAFPAVSRQSLHLRGLTGSRQGWEEDHGELVEADIRSREYIRKQLCSPLEVISSGPKRQEKETEPDD